jgi:hypothetical protein
MLVWYTCFFFSSDYGFVSMNQITGEELLVHDGQLNDSKLRTGGN